jgi:hypothetical protein
VLKHLEHIVFTEQVSSAVMRLTCIRALPDSNLHRGSAVLSHVSVHVSTVSMCSPLCDCLHCITTSVDMIPRNCIRATELRGFKIFFRVPKHYTDFNEIW